jgi:glycogen debranching enzyme
MSTETRSLTGAVVIDGISYIPSSALQVGIRKLSFKDDQAFGVLDSRAEAPRIYPNSELGIYFQDTRYLSIWEFTLQGQSPTFLSQELRHGGRTLVISMSNSDLTLKEGRIPRGSLLIRRVLTLDQDVLFETLDIKNFSSIHYSLNLEFWAGSIFDDIFEVRGFHRKSRGNMLEPAYQSSVSDSSVTLSYEGLDRKQRSVSVQRFFPVEWLQRTSSLSGAVSELVIPAKETRSLKSIVSFDRKADPIFKGREFPKIELSEKMQLLSVESSDSPLSRLQISSDNAIFDRAIQVAKVDIEMLLTREEGNLCYPYAGIPWFSAPFGRDGVVTAYQLLPWFPEFARGVLDYVFTHMGKHEDAFTEEQPGKVFHEYRRGEMAKTREIPYIPYYGTVDATPLALILLAEYIKWTGDLESLQLWWPQVEASLNWMRVWGDRDQDGWIEYLRQSETGLQNQGWKDSHDSIMHSTGAQATGAIRLK